MSIDKVGTILNGQRKLELRGQDCKQLSSHVDDLYLYDEGHHIIEGLSDFS